MNPSPPEPSRNLLELLEDAILEVDGDERETGQLREIVANVPFIPFPVSMSTPDKAKRISLGRIVAHSGAGNARRSDLLGWVVSKDKYEVSSLKLKHSLKRSRSSWQAGALCNNLWPDGDLLGVGLANGTARGTSAVSPSCGIRVRRTGHPCGQPNREYWRAAIASAKVYTSRKQWRPVASVYYDDLRKPAPSSFYRPPVATRGHLGADPITVEKRAALLGLKPLSERVERRSIYGEEIPLPQFWQKHLDELIDALHQYLEDCANL